MPFIVIIALQSTLKLFSKLFNHFVGAFSFLLACLLSIDLQSPENEVDGVDTKYESVPT